MKEQIEQLARKFHEVYQAEAKRQGDVRHHDNYDDLSENVKEFDRVLARFVLECLPEEKKDTSLGYATLREAHDFGWNACRLQFITNL